MKKIISFLLTSAITLTLFASENEYSSAPLVIARKGELPGGFFVKAAGYLPGDSVELTNPESGETISLLNLGSPDSYEEPVLLLSEEAAKKLGLDKNNKMSVRLASRSGSYDKSSKGSALLEKAVEKKAPDPSYDSYEEEVEGDDYMATKNALEMPSPDDEITEENSERKNTEVPVKEALPLENENPLQEENSLAEEEIVEEIFEDEDLQAPLEDEVLVEENKAETEPFEEGAEELFAEEIPEAEEIAEDAETIEEAALSESADEEDAIEDASESEAFEEENTEEIVIADELSPVTEENSSEEIIEENDLIPEEDLEGENVESLEPSLLLEDSLEEETLEEIYEDEIVSQVIEDFSEENPDEPVADFTVDEENVNPPEEDLAGENVEAIEPEEKITENSDEIEEDLEGEKVIEEEPFTPEVLPFEEELVVEENMDLPEEDLEGEKVESLEPEEKELLLENEGQPEKDLEGEKVENEDIFEEVSEEIIEDEEDDLYEGIVLLPADSYIPSLEEESVESKEEEVIEVVEEVIEKPSSIIDSYIVEEKDLKKSSYYIQIAGYAKEENLISVIEKYKKYPLVLIKKKDLYSVLVGPLSLDEYGAVLAKFKSFGFKDAFVKYIK